MEGGSLCEIAASLWERLGCIIILYCWCLAVSFLSGILVEVKGKCWKASKTMAGLWKIGGSLCTVMVGGTLDLLIDFLNIHVSFININIGNMPLFCSLVLAWCIASELRSILKNARKMGYVMPKFLEHGIAKLKETLEESQGEIEMKEPEKHNTDKNRKRM